MSVKLIAPDVADQRVVLNGARRTMVADNGRRTDDSGRLEVTGRPVNTGRVLGLRFALVVQEHRTVAHLEHEGECCITVVMLFDFWIFHPHRSNTYRAGDDQRDLGQDERFFGQEIHRYEHQRDRGSDARLGGQHAWQ